MAAKALRARLPSSLNAGSGGIIFWLASVFRFDQGRRRPHFPLGHQIFTMPSRIHPENRSLLDLPESHPAHCALLVHDSTRDRCVGHEIPRSGREDDAFDQELFSEIERRTMMFSGFAYAYISFDLILDAWLDLSFVIGSMRWNRLYFIEWRWIQSPAPVALRRTSARSLRDRLRLLFNGHP